MNPQSQLSLCERAIQLAAVGREAAIETAIALDAVYESRAFEVSQYGSEEVFLMELGMSQSNVSKYLAIGRGARTYALDRQQMLEAKNIESVYLAARQPTEAKAREVLALSSQLTFRDLKATVDGVDSCNHKWRKVKMRRCAKCKTLQAVDN